MTIGQDVSYVSSLQPEVSHYIANLHTQLDSVTMGDYEFPMTINTAEYDNSYVCSPYTALVPYAKEECEKIDSSLIRLLIKAFLPLAGRYMKKHLINQVVQINNWMLSTNLYPANWNGDGINNCTENLIEHYPEHTIMFRSLNYFCNKELINKLQSSGYELVPSRQIYLYHKYLEAIHKHNNTQHDLRLLKNTPYRRIGNNDIEISWCDRIAELYKLLYIDKYSIHNPVFTPELIKHMLKSPYFDIEVFVDQNDNIDAVGGRFQIDNTVTLPVVGYDTAKPVSSGLYRLVMISTIKYARDNNLILNASSGASQFKRLRGGVPFLEYSAIYIRHLPAARQKMWRRIANVLTRYIAPMLVKYEL
jgi:hypothetical protein